MRYFSFIILIGLVITSCQNETETKEQDPFLISNDRVGKISQITQVHELDSIYAMDSLVNNQNPQMRTGRRKIEVFDKSGKELLVLSPVTPFDSTSTIATVQIKDPRYKTSNGLSLKSKFKSISKDFKISRIENTLSNAIIFLDQNNIFLAIDKKHISGDAEYDTSSKIDPTQIEDEAPIKYLWVGWK